MAGRRGAEPQMRALHVVGRRRGGWGAAVALLAGLLMLGIVAGAAAWSRSLPVRAADTIRQALLGSVENAGSLEVQLASRPNLALLSGRVDRLEIAGRNLRTGDILADRFRLYGEGVRLDLAASARSGRLVIASARRLDLELVLSEQAVNDYLQRNVELARLLRVRLLPEGPRLLMEAQVQEQVVSFGLDGRLMVEPGNVVALVPDRLSIERDGTPALHLSLAGSPDVLRLALGELPVPVTIDRVETGDGELRVYGSYQQAAP